MIANLIGGFIAIIVGTSLIGTVSTSVVGISSSTNATGGPCIAGSTDPAQLQCQLYTAASWGTSVIKLVPGFFALGILGIGIAVTYSSLRQAGIV